MRGIITRATSDPKRVVFPEGEEPKIIRAAQICADEGICHPVLLGDRATVERTAREFGIPLDDVAIVDPRTAPRLDAYVRYLWERRQRKGLSLGEAQQRMSNPNYFGCCMVALGDADCDALGGQRDLPGDHPPGA
jgi:malate dehydrogenase (oxaloacetate-decarboxylating)(NADP+)